jgi:hypothetical protein
MPWGFCWSTLDESWVFNPPTLGRTCASVKRPNNKAIFYTINDCNTKQIFVGDDKSISVVGSRTI